MEPVNGLGALSEWVREKLKESAVRAERTSGAASAQAHASPPRSATAELERHMRAKLAELGPAAAQSTAARRSIIASLLLCELDERLHNESKFNGLVGDIQRAIDADAGLKSKFDALIVQLSKSTRSS